MVWDHIPGRAQAIVNAMNRVRSYEVLAENVLDDGFDASPALVGSEIYLRGFRYLYRISE